MNCSGVGDAVEAAGGKEGRQDAQVHRRSSVPWAWTGTAGETQRFSAGVGPHTGVLQEVFKHAVPDYLVRGTDLFPLRLSN